MAFWTLSRSSWTLFYKTYFAMRDKTAKDILALLFLQISFACIFLLNLINYRGFKIVLWMLASNLLKAVVLKKDLVNVGELRGTLKALRCFTLLRSITKQLFKFINILPFFSCTFRTRYVVTIELFVLRDSWIETFHGFLISLNSSNNAGGP